MELTDLGVLPPGNGIHQELATLYAHDAAPRGAPPARQPPEQVLLWESATSAVVLPRNGAADAWARPAVCASSGIPLLRRDSGGGAVVLGPGCLNIALILSLDARPGLAVVTHSYQMLLGALAEALALPGITIHATDLALHHRKFAGHAQRRLRHTLLHHGTILYDFDLPLIDALLPEPPTWPAWRGARPHRDFVANVPLARTDLVSRLQQLPAAIEGRTDAGVDAGAPQRAR